MRIGLLIAVFCTLLAFSVTRSSAIVVFRKGSDQPVMGLLISQDDRRVVVREILSDNTHRDHIILRAEIEEILLTVSEDRLQSLRFNQPMAYRDYAEELAEKRRDPEARQAAIRLYLISAYLDPDNLSRGSLLGMIDLARSPAEESGFRAMAYLLDQEHDRSVLRQPEVIHAVRSEASDELLRSLRMLRQGKYVIARRMLAHPKVSKQMKEFQEVVTIQELRQAARSDSITPSVLKRMLLLELALAKTLSEAPLETGATTMISWRDALGNDGLAPLPALTLETITEFDPRQNRFLDGKWVEDDR